MRVGEILPPAKKECREDVRDTSCEERTLRDEPPAAGLVRVFSPRTNDGTDKAIEAHVYDCVRNFLRGAARCPHRVLRHSARQRGLVRLASRARAIAGRQAVRLEPAMKPVGKPDRGNLYVRFDG
jgi:hypothetical protein